MTINLDYAWDRAYNYYMSSSHVLILASMVLAGLAGANCAGGSNLGGAAPGTPGQLVPTSRTGYPGQPVSGLGLPAGSATPGDTQHFSGMTQSQSGQGYGIGSEAAPGTSWQTGGQTLNSPVPLVDPNAPNLPPVATPGAAPGGPYYGLSGTGWPVVGSLPPTTLDSFVFNSGYNDMIYGDEGDYGPPPYWDFQYLGDGMWPYGNLTTGHFSPLPSAWGYTSGTY